MVSTGRKSASAGLLFVYHEKKHVIIETDASAAKPNAESASSTYIYRTPSKGMKRGCETWSEKCCIRNDKQGDAAECADGTEN